MWVKMSLDCHKYTLSGASFYFQMQTFLSSLTCTKARKVHGFPPATKDSVSCSAGNIVTLRTQSLVHGNTVTQEPKAFLGESGHGRTPRWNEISVTMMKWCLKLYVKCCDCFPGHIINKGHFNSICEDASRLFNRFPQLQNKRAVVVTSGRSRQERWLLKSHGLWCNWC